MLHSFLSNVEVYINNQQVYNSNGLYAHMSYISNKFKGAISEYKGVLHCEVYDSEDAEANFFIIHSIYHSGYTEK